MLFEILAYFEDILWAYFAVPAIVFLGLLLTWQSGCVQIRSFPKIVKNFFRVFSVKDEGEGGIPPLRVFFACVGGCIGVGNVVGICTAVQIGGPGALFWIWVTTLIGMVVKYGEVYLGIKYRVKDEHGNYHGGPMYFLEKIRGRSFLPKVAALLLCIYGVEVYQFNVITHSIADNLSLSPVLIAGVLLSLVLFAAVGGVKRVGAISSAIIPFFVVTYALMGVWVLWASWEMIPGLLKMVFQTAFSGHAAVGGFVGSTLMTALSHGVKRSCYTTDVGIGYASVIHSQASSQVVERQAALVVFDMFLDTFIVCTTSVFLILATDVWHQPVETATLIQSALSQYFPYMHIFIPFFLLLLGYNTINAYFCVGLRCAEYLSRSYGRKLYFVYAATTLALFTFIDTAQAQSVMTIAGGSLLLINCYGIFSLRKEISFEWKEEEASLIEEEALLQPQIGQ